jgi:hypothetical protein
VLQQLERLRQDAAAECAISLARIRREAAQALSAELSRLPADASDAQILELRARAESRLTADIAHARQESERRRVAREQALLTPSAAPDAPSAPAPDQTSREVAAEYAQALRDVAVEVVSHVRTNAPALAAQLRDRVRSAYALWRRLPPRTAAAVVGVVLLAASALALDVGTTTANRLASITGKMSTMAERASGAISSVNDEAVGRIRSDAEPAPAPPQPTPDRPAPAPRREPEPVVAKPDTPAATSGLLVVFSRVPLDLFLSGRRLGSTEGGDLVMPPGRHRIQVVSRLLNYQDEIVVDVRPAAVTSFTVSLPDGLIEVDAEPGAEIWIAGERAGVAPLAPRPIPLGTREVVARLADGSERRTSVLVKYGETARVVLDGSTVSGADPRFPLPRGSEFIPRDGR